MKRYSKRQYEEVVKDPWVHACVRYRSSYESPKWFLKNVFDLEWTEDEYADIMTGMVPGSSQHETVRILMVAGSSDVISDIYDARIIVYRDGKSKTYYLYNIDD